MGSIPKKLKLPTTTRKMWLPSVKQTVLKFLLNHSLLWVARARRLIDLAGDLDKNFNYI